ncbi:hypothetical protein BpHYR1_024356, partial [Brachionus plicatilis]
SGLVLDLRLLNNSALYISINLTIKNSVGVGVGCRCSLVLVLYITMVSTKSSPTQDPFNYFTRLSDSLDKTILRETLKTRLIKQSNVNYKLISYVNYTTFDHSVNSIVPYIKLCFLT